MLKVNTALVSGHFQNDEVVQPSLDFIRALETEGLENKTGVELGENRGPKKISKIPTYVPSEKITVKRHDGMWDSRRKSKKLNKNIKTSAVRTIQSAVKRPGSIVSFPRVYSCALEKFQIIKLRGNNFLVSE